MNNMTDLPVGPDLDRAVTLAMGLAARSYTTNGPAQYVGARYSTDPATLAETLAWLAPIARRHGSTVDIGVGCRAVEGDVQAVVTGLATGWGATLNEALCRLVLAVAAAKAAP